MQRRHRNLAVVDRAQVRAFRRIRQLAFEAQPEIGAAAQIGALVGIDDVLIAPALKSGLDLIHVLWRQIGKVDVDQHVLGPAMLQQLADDSRPVGFRRLPWDRRFLAAKAARLRKRDGGDAELHALHRPGDGAGEGHVLGQVLAAIDAGEHQIRRIAFDQMLHPQQHAIGWRAGYGEALGPGLAHADRRGQRQRPRGARLLGLRGDHPDIVGEAAGDAFEHGQPGGVDAVVIGAEDAHGRSLSAMRILCHSIAYFHAPIMAPATA